MLTSSERRNTTADPWPYTAKNLPSNIRTTLGIGAVSEPGARDLATYRFVVTTPPFDTSFAGRPWLIGPNVSQRDTDRKSGLRMQVLSYLAEPDGSSIGQAVNDALKFIDLVPATAILPQVALADDGEVNFFWHQGGLFIDIGFIGDGMIHYYVSADAEGVDSDASIQFSGLSLPRDIVRTMPRLRNVFGTDVHGRVY